MRRTGPSFAGRVTVGPNLEFGLARYRASDGQLDTTFGSGGTGKVTAAVGSLPDGVGADAIDSQGRIVVAGEHFGTMNYDLAVARFTPAGVLDTSFNGTG